MLNSDEFVRSGERNAQEGDTDPIAFAKVRDQRRRDAEQR
jgi:hypothetical protein